MEPFWKLVPPSKNILYNLQNNTPTFTSLDICIIVDSSKKERVRRHSIVPGCSTYFYCGPSYGSNVSIKKMMKPLSTKAQIFLSKAKRLYSKTERKTAISNILGWNLEKRVELGLLYVPLVTEMHIVHVGNLDIISETWQRSKKYKSWTYFLEL